MQIESPEAMKTPIKLPPREWMPSAGPDDVMLRRGFSSRPAHEAAAGPEAVVSLPKARFVVGIGMNTRC